jgi:hypothetical protein
MQLVRNSNRGCRTVTVLAQDDVGFTCARVIALEGVGPVQQNNHVRILL